MSVSPKRFDELLDRLIEAERIAAELELDMTEKLLAMAILDLRSISSDTRDAT